MKVIILAGGSGTRLWPLSRNNFPKQFIKLKNKTCSIFQMTVFPSDHIINDDLNFLNIIQKSRAIAQEYLVTY